MSDKPYVVIVGGINMDVAGISGPDYRERDSNIGQIHLIPGGVGRNIAHNLANLETPVSLLTAYGDDDFGQILEESCAEIGIDLSRAMQIPGARSSTFLYVADNSGDMITAINDMAIVDQITPDYLSQHLDYINGADLCVLDANISEESIRYLCDNVTVPIFADPVSVAKADRFTKVLDKIHTLKPNEYEAELYSGIKVDSIDSAKKAAQILLDKGIKNVFLSLGSNGMVCADESGIEHVPVLKTDVVSANGAGDCAMATIAWAHYYYDGALATKEVAHLASAAASITLSHKEAVVDGLSVTDVVRKAQEYTN